MPTSNSSRVRRTLRPSYIHIKSHSLSPPVSASYPPKYNHANSHPIPPHENALHSHNDISSHLLPPPVVPVHDHVVTPSSYITSTINPFEKCSNQLNAKGYPKGLCKSLHDNTMAFPLRIWVVDNSGSMSCPDGRRFVETEKVSNLEIVSCSRWDELQETMTYHVELAAVLNAPTVFRMLNLCDGVREFGIADKGCGDIESDLQQGKSLIRRLVPSGCTPLTRHVVEIRFIVQQLAFNLVREGKRVAIILATDGLPTDEKGMTDKNLQKEFIDALNSLQTLPVWVIIRLCTDREDVTQFYNNMDSELEISIEILDDFESEAKEVYKHNRWINYTLPLHRCREMGYHNRLLDLIDERPLTKSEVRDYCYLIFGAEVFDGVPNADTDWDGFVKSISNIVQRERKEYNPIKRKAKSWISIKALKTQYSHMHCIIQ